MQTQSAHSNAPSRSKVTWWLGFACARSCSFQMRSSRVFSVARTSGSACLRRRYWLSRAPGEPAGAGRWVRTLLGIQHATARIARGDLEIRLPTTRTDEIGDLIRGINSMAQGLERLESARRRWIAEISQELRTLLTVLRGELDVLTEGIRPLNLEGPMVVLDAGGIPAP